MKQERLQPAQVVSSNRKPIILITGIQAAGKSTVAQLLAQRFERGVHVEGDVLPQTRALAFPGLLQDARASG